MQVTAPVVREPGGPFLMEALQLETPRADEILVELRATGICHTDLSVRDRTIPALLPSVLGHEGAGVVRAVGSAVTGLAPGDHVLMSHTYCGRCGHCRAGNVSYCDRAITAVYQGLRDDGSCQLLDELDRPVHTFCQGSFGSATLVPAHLAVKLPPDLPLHLLAPLGCGIMTGSGAVINELKPAPDSSIVVFGAGGVGLGAVAAAAMVGCATVIVVDTRANRLATAVEVGATHTVDASREAPVGVIRSITSGGAQFSVEASGAAVCGPQAVACLTRLGSAAFVGAPGGGSQLVLDWTDVVANGKGVRGVVMGWGQPATFIPYLISHWRAGRFPIDRMITVFDFAHFDDAVAAMERGEVVKPVVRFDGL